MQKAIIHIDGDAFFASCEQVRNPRLKGKSVITGEERGIASVPWDFYRATFTEYRERVH